MTETAKYGFYSAEADARFGHVVYRTPDGREVVATIITRDSEAGGYDWPDKVAVGPVDAFVREVRDHALEEWITVHTASGASLILSRPVARALGHSPGKTLNIAEAWEAIEANSKHMARVLRKEIQARGGLDGREE